jgi:hypothetical protein
MANAVNGLYDGGRFWGAALFTTDPEDPLRLDDSRRLVAKVDCWACARGSESARASIRASFAADIVDSLTRPFHDVVFGYIGDS